MKRIKPIFALAAIAALAVGCAATDDSSEAAPKSSSAGTEDSIVTPSSEQSVTPSITEEPSPSVSSAPSATALPSPLPTTRQQIEKLLGPKKEPEVTERGAVAKQLGEPGAKGEENGTLLMSFRVNEIDPKINCQDGTKQPENGRYVAVDMDFQTTKAMADVGWDEFTPYDWEFVFADGTMLNGTILSKGAQQCLPTRETLPVSIGPSRKASGRIVLDVAEEPGFLIFGRDGLDNRGWEYKLP